MSIFALLSLIASILSLIIGYFVFRLDRTNVLNRVFIIFTIILSFWCFTEFAYRQANNLATAYFWMKLEFVWPFATVLTLHFALVFTEKLKSIRQHLLIGLLLYVPATILALVYLFTDLITSGVVAVYWGYTYVDSNSWVSSLCNIWAFAVTFSAIGLCFWYYLSSEGLKRKQAKFITLGFFIPVLIAFITYVILPFWTTNFPEMTTISTLILSLIVGLTIKNHHLFHITPSIAAETIIATIPDPLILTNTDERILRVNDAFTKMFGISQSKVTEKPIADILFNNSPEKIEPTNTLLSGRELKIVTKANQEKFVTLSRSPVVGANGVVYGAVYVLHDSTELKQLQKRLIHVERLSAIGELAGMVGHDLRNPLAGIKNASYILKKKGKKISDSEFQEMYQIIDVCINHSNAIINNLLEYSKDLQLNIQRNTVKNLLTESMYTIQLKKNIQFQDLTADHEIFVDSEKIKRVFINLINNAIDSMPQGGKLSVTSKQDRCSIEISFIDSGIGIPNDVLPKIFSPLITTKAQGMGLGLAICKRIIEEHKGSISVDTTVNLGTTFKIILPINAHH